MDSLRKKIYSVFYKPLLKLYLRRNRHCKFKGFDLVVLKGVFHPSLFFSTTYFFTFIAKLDLQDRNFLEVGSGSGVLSLLAQSKGAHVTAVDIDPLAVENTRINFDRNFGKQKMATIYTSDVFENVPPQKFDLIVANPPYYFKAVQHPSQQAWYCGEEGEYFGKFFGRLAEYSSTRARVYMILEENSEIERIKAMAGEYGFVMKIVEQKKIRWEISYIFSIQAILES